MSTHTGETGNAGRKVACTIVAGNYLAHARCLTESFLARHPDGLMYVLLVDRVDGRFDPAREQFTTLPVEDLAIPGFVDMILRYDLLELCTAVKPFLLDHLLRERGHRSVCYLDPDIRVYQPLTEAWSLLEQNAVVLTPHLLGPLPDRSDPDETLILQCGTYNLGFIGVSAHPQAQALLSWWKERMTWGSKSRIDKGFFVDQKWVDLVPGFHPATALIRHPGYNTAYWDLANRMLTRGEDGTPLVNGRELVFFHFSGFDPHRPARMSRYQNRFTFDTRPDVRPLFEDYRAQLLAHGFDTAMKWSNALLDPAQIHLDKYRIRALWRAVRMKSPLQWRPDPGLNAVREAELAALMCRPDTITPSALALVTPVMHAMHREFPMLPVVFPDPDGRDEIPFAFWFVCRSRRRHGIPRRFILPVAMGLARLAVRAPGALLRGAIRFGRLAFAIWRGDPRLEPGRGHLRL